MIIVQIKETRVRSLLINLRKSLILLNDKRKKISRTVNVSAIEGQFFIFNIAILEISLKGSVLYFQHCKIRKKDDVLDFIMVRYLSLLWLIA